MSEASISQNSFAYKNRWRALLFICVSLLVVALDNTILNVAIPSISRTLQASASELQWIVDSYILVFASLLLTLGALGDRFGRKRALQAGLVLFGIGSLAAALSNSTEMLIASRAFLGIAGAMILPATLSIISATFPREERPQAIAIWAAVFGLGVGLGPVIGGWLLERFEWNSVFFVNLPIVVVALVGGQFLIAESKDPSAPKADIPGVILSIIGLFALVYGIVEAGVEGWTASNVLLAFGAAIVFLGAFAWWENRNPDAMLPLDFFRNMSFTGANISLILISFSLFGSVFFLSQYFQSVLGFSPLQAGLRVLPLAITLTICSAMSARVNKRLGTKYTVALGAALSGAGLLFMALIYKIDTPYAIVMIGQILLAAGLGTAISPATNSVMSSVPVEKAGIGSAMNDTTRQLGGALGVAVLGTILNSVYLNGVDGLLGTVRTTLANAPGVTAEAVAQITSGIERGLQGAIGTANFLETQSPLAAPLAENIRTTARLAFVNGMTQAMFIAAIIMFASAVLVLFLLPSQVTRPAMVGIPAENQPVPIGD